MVAHKHRGKTVNLINNLISTQNLLVSGGKISDT